MSVAERQGSSIARWDWKIEAPCERDRKSDWFRKGLRLDSQLKYWIRKIIWLQMQKCDYLWRFRWFTNKKWTFLKNQLFGSKLFQRLDIQHIRLQHIVSPRLRYTQGKSSATNFDIWQKFEFEFMLFERVIYFSLLYWNNISTKIIIPMKLETVILL